MPPGKRQRKLLWVPALILVGIAVLLLLLPLWFPWILRPFARSQGIRFTEYQRLGFQRFAVSGVTYSNDNLTFTAGRVEALLPPLWLWRVAVAKDPGIQPFVSGSDCTLQSVPGGSSSGSPKAVSTEAQKIERTVQELQHWIPVAVISNAMLRVPVGEFSFHELLWTNGSVASEARVLSVPEHVSVRAARSGPGVYAVHLLSPGLHLESEVQIRSLSGALSVQSTNLWFSNRVVLEARFAATGTLPETASITAPVLDLPAAELKVPDYEKVRGSLNALWRSGAFVLDARANAEAPPSNTNLPPLTVTLHARGDTNSAIVETATVSSPLLNAELSRELTVYFTGKILREPARVAWHADLSRQNWFPVRGNLKGDADLSPGAGKYPSAEFQVEGPDVAYKNSEAARVEMKGRFDWPKLEVSEALIELKDGSRNACSGALDFEKKEVAQAKATASGPLLKQWLPPGYDYQALQATANVRGPFAALTHSGHVEVTNVSTPFLQPLSAVVDWWGKGTGPRITLTNLELSAWNKTHSLSLKGAAENSSNHVEVALADLVFRTSGQPSLALKEPVHLSAEQSPGTGPWTFDASRLELDGPGGHIELQGRLDWPATGMLELSLRNLSSGLVAGLVRKELPDVVISNVVATASWSNSPVQLSATVSANAAAGRKFEGAPRLFLDANAWAGANGVVISNLVLAGSNSIIAKAEGVLPITCSPGQGSNTLNFPADQLLRLKAVTDPGSALWQEVSRLTGMDLREPHLDLDISGTWDKPQGTVRATAAAVAFRKKLSHPLPTLEHLDVFLELDRAEAKLKTGRVLVQGQPVNFTAQLPLGSDWTNLLRGQLPDLDRVSGRVQVDDAEIAAFAPLFPNVVAPQGDLSLDVVLYPGRNFRGQLTIAHARTRPLGTTGPIRSIFVNLAFRNRTLLLERASADIGASTVSLTGEADLGGQEWLEGQLPPFNVTLHGIGVPIARQPEFVVRSDLLLGITKTNGGPPVITGAAQLHDSYYLSDLRDLVPGKVASPERRPPYFSIPDPLLADWRLAVDVSGAKFLRLRSPLFNGEISTNLKLQGTLKDPIALGDLRIDSGTVRFPFASLQVQHGLVTLTSQDPYHPQLGVNATSKQFGYDIRMNVTGPVDAPLIQFSSTPPLSSEQILLMVSAGELPQGTFNLTAQQRAQTVALFFGRDLLSKIGVGDETQQRLTIHSGEQISEQGRPTYQVEYQLTDRWALTGEYDRFGDFNAGFKWRVYSK